MARTKNVVVRKKKRADRPIDLRSEPMLLEIRDGCQWRSILNSYTSCASAHKMK